VPRYFSALSSTNPSIDDDRKKLDYWPNIRTACSHENVKNFIPDSSGLSPG